MTDTRIDVAAKLLERTPRVLSLLLLDLPEPWLTGTDTPGGWTARDVVGHLISAEIDDWIPRVERIVSDGTTRPFDPFDRFAHIERDRDVPMPALLARFGDLRAASLVRLGELAKSDAALDAVGCHPSLGEVTLGQLVATWAVHDLDHISQAFAALSASQAEAVGPWKAYLGILLRRDDPSARPG
jgi:hypothetical protein